MDKSMIFNDKAVTIKKWKDDYTVKLSELMDALGMGDKNGRDLLRHGIPEDSIVKVPLGKRLNAYYLKREGIEAFVKKYSPDNLEAVLRLFDSTIKIAAIAEAENDNEPVKVNATDPFAVDLLEDILSRLTAMEQDQLKFQTAVMSLFTRQMIMSLEFESLMGKTLAMIARAEAIGPVARLNKDMAKGLNEMAKDIFADAKACDDALQEYDNFTNDPEDVNKKDVKKDSPSFIKNVLKNGHF